MRIGLECPAFVVVKGDGIAKATTTMTLPHSICAFTFSLAGWTAGLG
jgi:hypothetical protein